MADNDDYEILYLKYLEKIGLTPPRLTVSQQNSAVKCPRALFQNIKLQEENYQQANYQRINLTSRQIQFKSDQLELDSIVSADKSPMQEIQTSLLQPSYIEQINDHSNNTNLCFNEQTQQQQVQVNEQQNNGFIEIEGKDSDLQEQEIVSQQQELNIIQNKLIPPQSKIPQEAVNDQKIIEITNQQIEEQNVPNSIQENLQSEPECIIEEKKELPNLDQFEQKLETKEPTIIHEQNVEPIKVEQNPGQTISKKQRKRQKQKQKLKLKKKQIKKNKQQETLEQIPEIVQENIPVVSNPVCSLFNELLTDFSTNCIKWSQYKFLQKKIKKKRSILRRSQYYV